MFVAVTVMALAVSEGLQGVTSNIIGQTVHAYLRKAKQHLLICALLITLWASFYSTSEQFT